jgi:hypothetical protein
MLLWGYELRNAFFGIDQIAEPPRIVSFAAKTNDEKTKYFSEYHHDRERMLLELSRTLDDADALVAWNLPFDDTWIRGEIREAGFEEPTPYIKYDLMREFHKGVRYPSKKLDYAARRFIEDSKSPVSALKIWLEIKAAEKAGNEVGLRRLWNKFRKYNIQDVDLMPVIYETYRDWLKPIINQNVYAEDGVLVCRSCGSDRLHKRGLYIAPSGTTYQVWRCECRAQTRSIHRIKGVQGR